MAQKFPFNVQKKWRKRRSPSNITFFSKIFPWLRTIRFWQPFRERFTSKLQTFPLIAEKDHKKYIFSCKIAFQTKKFLWSLTLQFWQTCWEIFATRPKNWSPDVQNWCTKWKFFKKKIYRKCSNGHVDFSFYNGAHQIIAKCRKWKKNHNFRRNFISHQIVPKITHNAVFRTLLTNFFSRDESFLLIAHKW